ncbi:MAG: hypothetical protein J5829_02995 [Lachnospiraceae bacterium]|nr:hypothetical protein [Lachnospiraceae bacterium]
MSNLLKRAFVTSDSEKKKVIDSNDLVAQRVEKLIQKQQEQEMATAAAFTPLGEDGMPDGSGFVEGLDAENVELLFKDGDTNAVQAPPPGPTLEEINEEAEKIIEDAKEQARQIVEDAAAEAEANRQSVYEEAKKSGYEDGYREGMDQVGAMKQELNEKADLLEQQYYENIEKLEPMFIDTLTDIYEHIFNVSLSENKDVICYLIQSALKLIDASSGMMIHVSKDDYGFVSMQKKELLSGISGAENVEIVEDGTLQPNEAFIETGGGIFDCSLETQLKGLKKQLRLLSYEEKADEEGE